MLCRVISKHRNKLGALITGIWLTFSFFDILWEFYDKNGKCLWKCKERDKVCMHTLIVHNSKYHLRQYFWIQSKYFWANCWLYFSRPVRSLLDTESTSFISNTCCSFSSLVFFCWFSWDFSQGWMVSMATLSDDSHKDWKTYLLKCNNQISKPNSPFFNLTPMNLN